MKSTAIPSSKVFFPSVKSIMELSKLRLSSLVVFSALIGYGLGLKGGDLNLINIAVFAFGSLLITASANGINQIIEKDLDKMMSRTESRPLPTGRLSISQALLFCILAGSVGALMVFHSSNLLATAFAMLSLILYAFVYTPLKRLSPSAVAVGAIPGALPPLIGWVAAEGSIGIEALILFSIQFIWQFPHFWAIAWVLDDDYKKAGFRLLPGRGNRDTNTAFQIMIYTLWLIPFGILPTLFGFTGLISAVVAILSGSIFLSFTFHLMRDCSNATAKKIMFASFVYLPVVQITFLLDKI